MIPLWHALPACPRFIIAPYCTAIMPDAWLHGEPNKRVDRLLLRQTKC